MVWYIFLLYGHCVIGEDGLLAFSEGLEAEVRASLRLAQGRESVKS